MADSHKAIRSSGWKTDLLIGFPDGLFLLFFTTQVMQGFTIAVQTFYNIQLAIWLIGALLVMFSAYRANRGDLQHDSPLLTPEEKRKLEKLDINDATIAHIAGEMQKDADLWEQTLVTENVRETTFSRGRAIRSAIMTGLFFIGGGALSVCPYLANENFAAAAKTSMMLVFLGLTAFSFFKARITAQRPLPIIIRYWLMGAGVLGGAWILQKVF
ncbi:VIT1/CCC1 transporter family protein [Chitinophaga sp. sic0106]|uniref:VIT1/CCC1 transporter family protein n=1 Tax=Chitinophaga sp. sic0106 TaxID=2854785 RepID=UPI001C4474F2|nr:VIT1/CCC1 transporter family protein [Chitinophaga sp. sic0106]MBV7529926.1 VIT1/CCC1 transporter family protein [Chitinophaga sp. sic0106]